MFPTGQSFPSYYPTLVSFLDKLFFFAWDSKSGLLEEGGQASYLVSLPTDDPAWLTLIPEPWLFLNLSFFLHFQGSSLFITISGELGKMTMWGLSAKGRCCGVVGLWPLSFLTNFLRLVSYSCRVSPSSDTRYYLVALKSQCLTTARMTVLVNLFFLLFLFTSISVNISASIISLPQNLAPCSVHLWNKKLSLNRHWFWSLETIE